MRLTNFSGLAVIRWVFDPQLPVLQFEGSKQLRYSNRIELPSEPFNYYSQQKTRSAEWLTAQPTAGTRKWTRLGQSINCLRDRIIGGAEKSVRQENKLIAWPNQINFLCSTVGWGNKAFSQCSICFNEKWNRYCTKVCFVANYNRNVC